MPSQFFGLNIAASGLRAANAALNTTSNNIANTQTDGYSKQVVKQEAYGALRTFTTYGCAGAGVDTIAIERLRDSFYDVKYWNNNSNLGEYTAKQYYMQTIEDYYTETANSGFKTIFNSISSSLQSVTTNSSSTSSKAEFIAAAKSLTDYFNSTYGNLQELQKDLNLEIKQTVDQINSIAEKVASLSKQINVIELTGTTANELRDQRENLIDELSLLVDVDITETPIYDTNDPTRETGGHRYLVSIAGGQTLVDASDYNTIGYTARSSDEKINQTDVDGLYNLVWNSGNEFSLTNAAMGGKLTGLIQMRDGNNESNFHGKVSAVTAGNKTATPPTDTTVSIKVEGDTLTDMKLCGLSDTGGSINIGNQIYNYKSWEYDEAAQTYTFTMDDTKSDTSNLSAKIGKDAKTSEAIDYQGIPYYMEQMNAWIRGFSEKMNDIFTAGYDENGDNGCILFTGTKADGTQYAGTELDATTGNGYYELSAGNFTINTALIDNAGLLGTREDAANGVEECKQIDKAITLLTSKTAFSFRNSSASEFLELILSDATLAASEANTFYDTYSSMEKSIDNQRTSISGVDEDEEAVNLVKYQNSYTLASKMIQTLTEIYDRLILETGV